MKKLKQLLDVPFAWDVNGVMGIGVPDLARINPRVLEASLIRLSLGELVSGERHGEPAPKELIEERDAGPMAPDLAETMKTLDGATRFTDAPVPPNTSSRSCARDSGRRRPATSSPFASWCYVTACDWPS